MASHTLSDQPLDIESAARLAFAPAVPETRPVTRTYPPRRRNRPLAPVLIGLALAIGLLVAF